MKALAAAIGAVALLGGFHSFHDEGDGAAVAADHGHAPGTYRLIVNGGDVACTVTRGADLAGGLSELIVGAGCPAVLPGIERARFWRDRKDGTVGFSENGADPLVSFEAGDGVDYESYAPALPLLTLVAE
ncbi:MAG: hypothetical protein ACTHOP_05080 [Mesorhizobium sp.]